MKNPNAFVIKKNLRGFNFTFNTTYDLFSYRKIDKGTHLLIDSIDLKGNETLLDLGCGYGVVGIVIAKLAPKVKVYFVDRDFVALDYTKLNCELNKVTDYQAILSNGFSNLAKTRFDVIASNLPTHIAKESLELMFKKANEHLNTGGCVYIVSVNQLKPYIQRQLQEAFGNVETIIQRDGYSVSLSKKQ